MTAHISGMGWATPLGSGLDEVWSALMEGKMGATQILSNPISSRNYHFFPVPPQSIASAGRNPRLRRSSTISALTATAGLAALQDAGITVTPETAHRMALVFAMSSGGVIYTRRFYHTIATENAAVASPLLFPETVYNAPASHLAAMLGITGMSYTLVGDSSVGLSAVKYAEQLLTTSPELDCCLVVGGEEVDWVLCEAYAEWRLIAREPQIRVYDRSPAGTVLGEGGAAVVVARSGAVSIAQVHPGVPFLRQDDCREAAHTVIGDLANSGETIDLVVGSANGTFIDRAESEALETFMPKAQLYAPKPAVGEALGASGLLQVICAALALRRGEIPPTIGADSSVPSLLHEGKTDLALETALVSSIGWNQQASGALLKRVG